MRVPWWAKIAAKILLARLPIGYEVWRNLGLFRHGCMDSCTYAMNVFAHHLEKSGQSDRLRDKTVLELGPGDSIATAVIAAAHGARAILIDTGRFSRSDVEPYRILVRALLQRGLSPPDLGCCRSLNDVLECCNSSYLSNGLTGLRTIASESVDLLFSHAVLEHVRRRDFLELMRQCRRVVKRTGVCSHTVDLRDHLSGELNNLRFSERIWESEFFAKSGFYTNRISFKEMQRLFREAGFGVTVDSIDRWDRLPTPRSKLSKAFQREPDDVLCVSGFRVVLH